MILPQLPSLIDEVLPTRRIHLLAGVSDAGKTRFILPAMLEWEKGEPVLGRKSYPRPWAYVIGDRTLQDAYDSMRGMGINPDDVRCIPAFGKANKNVGQVLMAAQQMKPVPELLVWEGFQDLPEGDRRQEVRTFLCNMSAYCEGDAGFPNGLTILGIVESPKLKPTERYTNPRQRVSGVSAWGYHSSTILLLESLENDLSFQTPNRILWICTKNGPRRCVSAAFNTQGRLVSGEEIVIPEPSSKTKKKEKVPLRLELPIS